MKLLGPLTDGEIEEAVERWMTYATTEEDWKVVRAFTELKHQRERQLEARIRQAECDDDSDTCLFIGVTA